MKCLSIRQPWVWAIFYAGKDIENRGRYTYHRGRLYIHAAKGMTQDEYIAASHFILTVSGKMTPPAANLVRGSIIGYVDVVDCVEQSDSPWYTGKYGIVIRDPVLLPEPIPARGQLGIWGYTP